ncbi:hypothetical protein VTJ83DRAFT_2025 [Remersonia thermophila]|uniref:Uncharacterized protein n=1 Tax=Remersonia thermophila TaxID=72144 RepID=A0ABR4DJ34_9PEZI
MMPQGTLETPSKRRHRRQSSPEKDAARAFLTTAWNFKGDGFRFGASSGDRFSHPKEKDEFIQSWLQSTQARRSSLQEPSYRKDDLRLAGQHRGRTQPEEKRKRPWSLSEQPSPDPATAERVEDRFEKRARHKTRDTKYDYKAQDSTRRLSNAKKQKRKAGKPAPGKQAGMVSHDPGRGRVWVC